MLQQLSWSDRDWDLVVELLEREEKELSSEIHHTSTPGYRETLRERRGQIRRMRNRIKACREQAVS